MLTKLQPTNEQAKSQPTVAKELTVVFSTPKSEPNLRSATEFPRDPNVGPIATLDTSNGIILAIPPL
jgi:hypothetical protein